MISNDPDFETKAADVIGLASPADKVDAAVERLSRRDAPAHGFSLDVREPEAATHALASFVQRQGKIDVPVPLSAGNFLQPLLT